MTAATAVAALEGCDMAGVATLEEFFAALFPGLSADTHVELRALPSRERMMFTEPGMVEDMREQFLKKYRTDNLYFGVATRIERDGELGGDADHCGVLNALFADFDYKDTREADVLERLAACPIAPSVLVASGGGQHGYWLLTEPIPAKDGEVWLRRLAATLGSDPAATDAARILRVPGTINWKYTLPRKAKITSFEPTRRYALEAFAVWLNADPKTGRTGGAMTLLPRKSLAALPAIDLVGEFRTRGLYLNELRGGKHAVTCPWAHEHSMESGESETAIWPPDDSHDLWGFKCLHGHCANRTVGDVLKLFGIATTVATTAPGADAGDLGGERYTDMANAARLAAEAAGQIAHVEEMKDKWYVFNGVRLVLEPKTAVLPHLKAIARRLYSEAAALNDEATERERVLEATGGNTAPSAAAAEKDAITRLKKQAAKRRDGAARLESRDGAYAAIDLAKAEPDIRVRLAQLDAHPLWLNTPTGTLDLETGEVHGHRFEDYLTRVAGAAYDPAAECPRWNTFLATVLPDPDVREFMQRSVGLALTDITSEQCMWFLYGLGRNGKSTFINAVRAVLGEYPAATKASTLMIKAHGDDKRNDLAVLRGARFVSATEAEDGQQMAEALVKEITGQDPVTARLMYAEFFSFVPT